MATENSLMLIEMIPYKGNSSFQDYFPSCYLLLASDHIAGFVSLTKITSMPLISPAETGLLEISRELQFGVCKHGKSHASPPTAGEEVFIEGK